MSTLSYIQRFIVILLILSVIIGSTLGCSGGGTMSSSTTPPSVVEEEKCPYGEFECNDGKSCYTEDQKCDNKRNCADNTDEDEHHCGNFKFKQSFSLHIKTNLVLRLGMLLILNWYVFQIVANGQHSKI